MTVSDKDYLNSDDVEIKCAGKSTTTAGSWELASMVGKDAGSNAEKWLTQYLNAKDTLPNTLKKPEATYKLVRSMQGRRMVDYNREFPILEKIDTDPEYAKRFDGNEARFQDFAPFLMVSADSLDWLNEKVEHCWSYCPSRIRIRFLPKASSHRPDTSHHLLPP